MNNYEKALAYSLSNSNELILCAYKFFLYNTLFWYSKMYKSVLFKYLFLFSNFVFSNTSFGQHLSDKNCDQFKCQQHLDIKKDGYYIFSSLVEDDALIDESNYNYNAGSWSLSLESNNTQIKSAPIHFGAKISSSERKTAFVSFYTSENRQIRLKARDYTSQLSEVKIKVYRRINSYRRGFKVSAGSNKDTLIHEQIAPLNTQLTISNINKGHYLITFSGTESVEGKLGVTLNGLPSLSHISFGGLIGVQEDSGALKKYEAFNAMQLNAGNYIINTTALDGQPNLIVKLAKSDGGREQIYNNHKIRNIYPNSAMEFRLNSVDYNKQANIFSYAYTNTDNGSSYIEVYDIETGMRRVLNDFEPVDVPGGEYHNQSYGGMKMSADGSKVAFNHYESAGYIGGETSFSLEKTYLYDINSGTTDLIRSESLCFGSTCSMPRPSGNFGVSDSGRFIAFSQTFPVEVTVLDTLGINDDFNQDFYPESAGYFSLNSSGNKLLFNTNDNNLVDNDFNEGSDVFIKNIDGDGNKIISILKNNLPIKGENFAAKYGANEEQILFLSNTGPQLSLYLFNETEGYSQFITVIGQDGDYAIDESGEQIVFTSSLDFDAPKAGDNTRLWLYDLTKNKLTLKATSKQKLKRPHISADGNSIMVVAERNEDLQLSDKIYLIENQRNLSLIELN